MHDSHSRVVIVGGGLAGLAAATALAERRIPALLLESRPRLGGRASSFLDSAADAYVDNCQHVSMGCCTNYAHFVKTVGLESYFRRERTLYFIGPSGRTDVFSASRWPCPFHLAGAFRRLSYLSWSDRYAIARGLRALALGDKDVDEDVSFAHWLKRHRQPPGAIDGFWHVVLVSALSESLDRISVPHARKVFVDAFLRHRDGWLVEIPTVPLETLYGERLIGWLAARGVKVRLQAGVERLELGENRITAARLRDGAQITGDEFVLAVPHVHVAAVLPGVLSEHETVRNLSQLETAPISSLHLWFDRAITRLPHAVFVGRLSQWLFNRTAISQSAPNGSKSEKVTQRGGDAARRGEHYCQIVISASRNLAGLSQDEVERKILAELREIWPNAREAQVVHRRLVTERRAVFSVRPGAERLRPPQQSPIGNLQWAGDWTRTGWPATMEGAVRSGYLAAENILVRLGMPERLIQPDLPTAFWSRWLLNIS